MTGCCADYCTNSSNKGYKMSRFPREIKRRKIWIDNVNRADWIPSLNAMLCEAHFSEDSWIRTPDGKQKLAPNAVPTIFHNRVVRGIEEVVNDMETQQEDNHSAPHSCANKKLNVEFMEVEDETEVQSKQFLYKRQLPSQEKVIEIQNNDHISKMIDSLCGSALTMQNVELDNIENQLSKGGGSRLLMYDEDTIIRVRQDEMKSKKKKEAASNVNSDLPLTDNRESCVVSPNPSSNYIDSTYNATHVATLVKENMDLTKQTNTIAQAILLNMAINKSDVNESNLDSRNIRLDHNKDFENQEAGDDLLKTDKLDDKLAQDLKNCLGTIKVSISEMNNNYYGSEFIKNDPMQFKLPLKEIVDNRSVISLLSNAAKSETKKKSSNTIHYEKESVLPKQNTNVNNQRRPSMQSVNSNQSNIDSHVPVESNQ